MPYTGSPPSFTAGEKTGVAAKLNQLRDAIRGFTDPWSAYTPTLTASTTNPTGWTLTGYYMRAGKLVVAKFKLTAGASMTAGSGEYHIALPAAAQIANGTWESGQVVLSHSSNTYIGQGDIINGSYLRVLYLATVSTAGFVSHSAPWAWASTDFIRGQITYEAA